jgi:hypothetical protein
VAGRDCFAGPLSGVDDLDDLVRAVAGPSLEPASVSKQLGGRFWPIQHKIGKLLPKSRVLWFDSLEVFYGQGMRSSMEIIMGCSLEGLGCLY